jgi:hypothetical protein
MEGVIKFSEVSKTLDRVTDGALHQTYYLTKNAPVRCYEH